MGPGNTRQMSHRFWGPLIGQGTHLAPNWTVRGSAPPASEETRRVISLRVLLSFGSVSEVQ